VKPEIIVIAGAAEARILKRASHDEPLVPALHLQHPESRLRSSQLASEGLGHGSSDHRPGGTSFEPKHNAHDKEALKFAHEVAQHIEQALQAEHGSRLVVFASSPFLGELREALGSVARERLQASFDLDLTHYALTELEERIAARMDTKRST
jgi:protein required for attachment to host cells